MVMSSRRCVELNPLAMNAEAAQGSGKWDIAAGL